MTRLRMLLLLSLCSFIAMPALAEEKPKTPKLSVTSQVLMKMDKLRKDIEQLDLTPQQKEQLGKLREEWAPKMQELLGRIREVLTEQQRTAAEDAMRKSRESGKEMRESLQAVEAVLTLSDEQQKTLDEVGKELQVLQKEAAKNIMEVLTPEQRDKIRQLAEKQKDQKVSSQEKRP